MNKTSAENPKYSFDSMEFLAQNPLNITEI